MAVMRSDANEVREPLRDSIVIGDVSGSTLVGSKSLLNAMIDHDLNGIRSIRHRLAYDLKLPWNGFCRCGIQIVVVAALVLMAGCSTPPARTLSPSGTLPDGMQHATVWKGQETESRPQQAKDGIGSIPVPAEQKVLTENITPPSEPPSELGMFAIQIESLPSGAMIVINGVPSGRTPKRILLAGTSQGFARERISIKVRFLAIQPSEESVTVEDQLTPLDRIPAGLIFTPKGGAQRRW